MVARETVLWMQHPIFATLGTKGCEVLSQRYESKLYRFGEDIFQAHEPAKHLHVLLSGSVQVYHQAEDGRRLVVKLLHAPNIFGEIEIWNDLCLLESVAALDEALVALIPKTEYLSFLKENPHALFEDARQLAAAFCIAARNERQMFSTLDRRMANLLLSYAKIYGDQQDEKLVIKYPLSQNDLALSLGVVRRSIADVVSKWIKAGWLSKKGGHFILENTHALEELAASIRGGLYFRMGMTLESLHTKSTEFLGIVEILNGPKSTQGQRFPITKEILIGRLPPSHVRVPDETVSPQHCRIFVGSTGQRYWIEDLGSLNGTYIKEKKMRRAVLSDGDEFQLGYTRFL